MVHRTMSEHDRVTHRCTGMSGKQTVWTLRFRRRPSSELFFASDDATNDVGSEAARREETGLPGAQAGIRC